MGVSDTQFTQTQKKFSHIRPIDFLEFQLSTKHIYDIGYDILVLAIFFQFHLGFFRLEIIMYIKQTFNGHDIFKKDWRFTFILQVSF